MKRAVIVVDLGFGDAGKGLVTDALVRRMGARTVVRFNGGAQAGHNVVLADGRHHTFSQLGAGTFVPGVRTVLTRHVAIHPTALLVEAERLARIGVEDALDRVLIDERARVTTPFHQAANRLRELARGEARHGSCGIGFGETIADAEAGHVVTAADLRDPPRLRARLVEMQERKRAELRSVVATLAPTEAVAREREILETPHVVDAWMDRVAAFVTRARIASEASLRAVFAEDAPVVFEGAQGVLLDEWYGFHPHTTWSTCTFHNAHSTLAEHGYSGDVLRLGVLRTFAVRHGAGPLPTEDACFEAIAEPHNVLGPWQGRVRRGLPDAVLVRYARDVCKGVDALALTHLDALPRIARYGMCTHYEQPDGSALSSLPIAPPPDLEHQARLTQRLAHATPRIEWFAKSAGVRREEEVVARFAAEAGAPVVLCSRGPRAEDVSLLGGWCDPLATSLADG
jgi:adenylosuccinate synthase